ncbi:MAG TPA: hypothetical protein VKY37_12350 [Brumimicrobium sp.]|nr:hypothetical protein [Brumimicrobium sp.]
MREQTQILIPNPKSANAPYAFLEFNRLIIRLDTEVSYNYAVSSGDGSVVSKGTFETEIELELPFSESSSIFQLDIFNADHHFTYNFIVPRASQVG